MYVNVIQLFLSHAFFSAFVYHYCIVSITYIGLPCYAGMQHLKIVRDILSVAMLRLHRFLGDLSKMQFPAHCVL